MKAWLMLSVLILFACSEELSTTKPSARVLPWSTVTTTAFDPISGESPMVTLPITEQQQALRLTAEPGTCFQVTSAITETGQELAEPFIRDPCPACLWRTSVIRDSGLLILEGKASRVSSIGFSQIHCKSYSPVAGTSQLTIESLGYSKPTKPIIQLRLSLSIDLDVTKLIQRTEAELGFAVEVVAVETIDSASMTLLGNDPQPLQNLLARLPEKDEGVIDVVIGICLERDNQFSIQPLAGFTPRIPGGSGPADAVFVSSRSCQLAVENADQVNDIARITAHELGHYLGLLHPEDTDGITDDLASTTTHNLMHREPLRLESKGLTNEQMERLLAHPFVINGE